MKKLDMKSIKDILALTPMQEGMLFHYLKDPGSDANFEQLYLEISGKLEREPFERAWNFVINSNEMLRTVFRWENLKQPAQMVLEQHRLDFRYFDLSGKGRNETSHPVEKIKIDDRNEKFDFQEVPFRVTLCKMEEAKYGVIISNHHILYDGWSNGIILKEFFKAYNDLTLGRLPITPVKTKFREFVKWSQNRDREKEEAFWTGYLEGFERKHEYGILSKKVSPGTAKFYLECPLEIVNRLNDFTRAHKISLTLLLYTAWGILLQKYHNADDVLFDATVSGRSAKVKGIEEMVGLFINTLPLRINTCPGETVTGLLARLKERQRKWEEFENTSTLTVKEYTEKCRNPVCFDSVLVVENYPLDSVAIQQHSQFSIDSFSNTGMTHYDLTLLITVSGPLKIELSYNVDLFPGRTMALLGRHFISVLDEMVSNPGQTAREIDLPKEEMEEIEKILKDSRGYEPGIGIESGFTAPRNTVEEKLVEIWSDVLNRGMGIDDNFFAFGGHSLKASLLAARMHREFNVKIPLAEVFRRPTIRELARFIKGASQAAHTPLEFVEKKSYYPLSSAQKRMAGLQRLDPGSTAYNVSSAVEVQGPLDTARLGEVFQQLIARHEIFRTSFQYLNGELFQRIQDNVDFTIEIESVEMGYNTFVRPFDLSQAPLLRVGLAKIGEERRLLIMDMHHIITDGISMNLFIKELMALYKGEQLPLPTHHYKDFCQWQTHRLNSGELKSEEEYWLDHLSGEIPILNLRTDFPRPLVQSFAGGRMTFHLEDECTRELHKLVGQTGTTLFMIFLAALNILLSRYTSQESEDIIIGTTTAGRDHIDVQNIMGLFIETLALRNKPVGDKRFITFLKEVKENTLNAFENEAYPFRELMQKFGAANDIGRNPLFNVMLIVQNIDMTRLEIEGLTFIPVDFRSTDSKVDFTVEVFEDETGIRFNLEYSTALFQKNTIERLGFHFTNILNEVVNRPEVLLSDIEMLNNRERDQLLEEFSGSEYKKLQGMYLKVHQLFEKQQELIPDHIAVVFEEKQMTYRELNEKADALSEILKGL